MTALYAAVYRDRCQAEHVARRYGGEVTPWKDNGEWVWRIRRGGPMSKSTITCFRCLHRDCTPEGLEFEPAAVGDGVATFVCDCEDCHPQLPLAERLAAERQRLIREIGESR